MKKNALPLLLGAGALFLIASRKSSGGTKSTVSDNGLNRQPGNQPSTVDLSVPAAPVPENPIGPMVPGVMANSRSRIG